MSQRFFNMIFFLSQEDAAITNNTFTDTKALYGVFDGHGGGEVAQYTKKHLENILTSQEEWQNKDYLEGMRKGFL